MPGVKPDNALAPARTAPRNFAIAVLLAGAATARAIDARIHEFSPDQQWSVDLAAGTWRDLLERTAADTHPPFYYMMLKCWFAVLPGEPTLFGAQLLSVLFSTLAVWLVWEIARDIAGGAAAWAAAVTAGFAPYAVYWGHAARMHPIQPFFVAAIVLASHRFLAGGARRWWLAAAAAWLFAIQLNYMALVFGIVWGAAFLLLGEAPSRRRLLLAAAPLPGLASFAPWLPTLLKQTETGPMNHNFFQETVSPVYLYFHALFGRMEAYQPPMEGVALYGALIVFTIVCAFGARAIGRRWWFWVLLLAGPTVPIMLAKWRGWTLAERHLLFTLPAFYVYWGAALVDCYHRLRARKNTAP